MERKFNINEACKHEKIQYTIPLSKVEGEVIINNEKEKFVTEAALSLIDVLPLYTIYRSKIPANS